MACAFIPGVTSSLFGQPPLTVELAGLAGVGKSTVAAALAKLEPGVRVRPRVSERSYLASVPALVPTFLSLHWPFRGVLTKEMKRILRVRALHRLVRTSPGGTFLFDEGPVYLLARLLMFGGDNIKTAGFARWWRSAVTEWAATLDVVIWLEAPDDVLARRLHNRRQWHPLQGAHDRAVSAFFQSYRDAFSRVLAELRQARGPEVWTVATDRGSADQTARLVLARIRALRAALPVPEMA
jgi:predicted kinase